MIKAESPPIPYVLAIQYMHPFLLSKHGIYGNSGYYDAWFDSIYQKMETLIPVRIDPFPNLMRCGCWHTRERMQKHP